MATRRAVLAGTAAMALAPRMAFGQAEPPKPKQIVINASGGSQIASLRKSYINDFEKETGIKVVDTSPVDFGKLRAMVESGNVAWNISEIGGQDGYRVTQLGLAEPIDGKIVDRSKFLPQAQMSHVFSASAYSTVIAYRPDAFLNGAPKSWSDFWDVKNFPGPRSLRNHPVDNLEAALMADGIAPDKIYPIDVDRAFKKLDEIHKHINVWWTTGQQPAQLLVDKEVVLATGWNGRFYDLIRKDAPIAMEWNGGILKQGSWIVPKGAKDQYWAMKLLATMADPKRQAANAEVLGYSGMHVGSNEFVAEKFRPLLPLYPEHLKKQIWLDQEWWTTNGAAMGERWNKWMLAKG
ncbi:MAG: ABC transporter substrate-binding protein [Hyphomicrobiaceae bacterium]